jgi:hypothetical protein
MASWRRLADADRAYAMNVESQSVQEFRSVQSPNQGPYDGKQAGLPGR